MTRLKKFAYLVLLAVLTCETASSDVVVAGSWSSGGGEILEHAQNPWFVKIPGVNPSTPQRAITYCVEVGQDFPISRRQLEMVVGESIVWWRKEFSNAHMPINKVVIDGQIKELKVYVNTDMTFKEVCEDTVDLAFQFGWLSQNQQQEIDRLKVDLTKYVALSIRTDYSTQLRGKGFIYVSPDRGQMAFRGANILSNAWGDGDTGIIRLKSVVQHELGHVFGLPHAADEGAIMDAKFAESVVDRNRWYSYLATIPAVFFPKAQGGLYQFCKNIGNIPFDIARSIFGINESENCFQFFWDLNRFSIYTGESRDSRTLRASARFTDGGKRRHKQIVSLWLPSDQVLIPKLATDQGVLFGPASTEIQQQGELIVSNSDGSKRKVPMTIQVSPRFFQVSTLHEGKIYPDLLPYDSANRKISGWVND